LAANLAPLLTSSSSSSEEDLKAGEVGSLSQKEVTSSQLPTQLLLLVSGGADSTSLLHGIMEVLPSSHPRPHVIHFNHKQRGLSSDEDATFVHDLAALRYSLPFHCYDWPHDSDTVPFSQAIARKWRRETSLSLLNDILANATTATGTPIDSSLADGESNSSGKAAAQSSSPSSAVLSSHSISPPIPRNGNGNNKGNSNSKGNGNGNTSKGYILSGHHKNDNVETVLMTLLRGVHIGNIKGMEKVTTDDFARPLLNVRRSDIEAYLTKRGFAWQTDESNADSSKYKRNKVRNDLMPLLEELAGGELGLSRKIDGMIEQSQLVSDMIKLNLERKKEMEENVVVTVDDDDTTSGAAYTSASVNANANDNDNVNANASDSAVADAEVFQLSDWDSDDITCVEQLRAYVSARVGRGLEWEKVQLLRNQLRKGRGKKWLVDIGRGYKVVRVRDALRVER
jgi:tRNA(Ile)-lysidine synthase TilS/MesJ